MNTHDTHPNSSPTLRPDPAEAPAAAEPAFAAFVAIDWADKQHAVVLRVAGQNQNERRLLPQTPEALSEWIAQLRERFGGRPVAVILEQKRGALLYALQPHEHLVLYPVNPQMSASFRQAFYCSGAKDDPTDAELQLDILLHHRDRLQAWHPEEPITRQLTLLVEGRRRFVADQVRLGNRQTQALKTYFPQALELVGKDVTSPMACAFLQKWPTLEAVQKVKPATLRNFYYAHHCRSENLIQERLQLVAKAQPLTTDKAIIAAQSLLVQCNARELAGLNPLVALYEKQIAQLFAQHADFAIWDSFPGVGEALGPRLAAAWGTQRERFAQALDMSCYSGIAPVKEQSGKGLWIHMRWACPKFLRQTFHEMAKCSLNKSQWARCYYHKQARLGKGHHTIIRALAFKWQRIMWRCWFDHVPYDNDKYLQSLQRTGSHLHAALQLTPT